jgi:RNA polymerase sigma factor (sigma-70 family)
MEISDRRPAPARRSHELPLAAWRSKRLAARAVAGDERAFTLIFERHHQELYRYCLALLRSPADAEDALQQTMSKALQALPGEEREIQLRPWLFRVAHNESVSLLRDRQATAELDEEAPGPAHAGPVAQAEQSERMRTLVADLSSLPDRQRSALVMRELSGLGYGEIAAALDCGEGAARQTVYEARSALQTREEGRTMDCADVRRAISDGDRRRLRGRKLRAHLDGCDGCADFQAAIDARRHDLAALCPPLPAAAAAGVLGGLLSSGAGGAGAGLGAGAAAAGAGSIASGVGSAAAIKGASIVAALALAAGGADATGLIDLPNPLRSGSGGSSATTGNDPAGPDAPAGSGSTAPGRGAGASSTRGAHGNHAGGQEGVAGKHGSAKGAGKGEGNDGGTAGNSGKTPPGQSGETGGGSGSGSAGVTGNGGSGETGPPANSNAGGNGNGVGVPGGGSSSAPGQTGTAPGQAKEPGTSAGNGTPAGGSSGSTGSNAGGNGSSGSGSSATAPGHTGTPPETSNAGGNGKNSADTT